MANERDIGGKSVACIRVFIVDQNTILREALKAILGPENDIEIAGEASNVDEALTGITSDNTDIILTSIYLPDQGLCRLLEFANSSARFIVFSLGRPKEARTLLFDLKVSGLLKMNAVMEDIKQAVRTVASGDIYIDPVISDALLDGNIEKKGVRLSNRQLQILKMICEGFTNKRISFELGISEDTVKTHVRSILKKLGAADRAQAVSKAYESAILK
ncbi:MAG: response regulator transcription factor [Actinobacteria bacterium]|nr:response regulator transcription factor [Actinomycetota bacterium]